MYEQVFQFNSRPFTTTPFVKHYFAGSAIHQALGQARLCIDRASGPVVMIGEIGTGKSLALAMLEAQYKLQFTVVNLGCARLENRKDLLQSILFGIDRPVAGMTEAELRFDLMAQVKPNPNCPNGMLLLVDDAEQLHLDLIDELRLITNYVVEGQPRIRLVMAGRNQLDEKLNDPKIASFAQRIASRCYLTPLNREETLAYVQEHIDRVGGNGAELFPRQTIAKLHEHTDGIPRLINQVCDFALICTGTQGKQEVTPDCITDAWADVQSLPGIVPDQLVQATPPSDDWTVIEFGQLDDDSETGQQIEVTVESHPVPSDETTQDSVNPSAGLESENDRPQLPVNEDPAQSSHADPPLHEDSNQDFPELPEPTATGDLGSALELDFSALNIQRETIDENQPPIEPIAQDFSGSENDQAPPVETGASEPAISISELAAAFGDDFPISNCENVELPDAPTRSTGLADSSLDNNHLTAETSGDFAAAPLSEPEASSKEGIASAEPDTASIADHSDSFAAPFDSQSDDEKILSPFSGNADAPRTRDTQPWQNQDLVRSTKATPDDAGESFPTVGFQDTDRDDQTQFSRPEESLIQNAEAGAQFQPEFKLPEFESTDLKPKSLGSNVENPASFAPQTDSETVESSQDDVIEFAVGPEFSIPSGDNAVEEAGLQSGFEPVAESDHETRMDIEPSFAPGSTDCQSSDSHAGINISQSVSDSQARVHAADSDSPKWSNNPFAETFEQEETLRDRFTPIIAAQNQSSLQITSKDLSLVQPIDDTSQEPRWEQSESSAAAEDDATESIDAPAHPAPEHPEIEHPEMQSDWTTDGDRSIDNLNWTSTMAEEASSEDESRDRTETGLESPSIETSANQSIAGFPDPEKTWPDESTDVEFEAPDSVEATSDGSNHDPAEIPEDASLNAVSESLPEDQQGLDYVGSDLNSPESANTESGNQAAVIRPVYIDASSLVDPEFNSESVYSAQGVDSLDSTITYLQLPTIPGSENEGETSTDSPTLTDETNGWASTPANPEYSAFDEPIAEQESMAPQPTDETTGMPVADWNANESNRNLKQAQFHEHASETIDEDISRQAEAILQRLNQARSVSHGTDVNSNSEQPGHAVNEESEETLDPSKEILDEIREQREQLTSSFAQTQANFEATKDDQPEELESTRSKIDELAADPSSPQSTEPMPLQYPMASEQDDQEPHQDDSEMIIVNRMNQQETPKGEQESSIPLPETPISTGRAQRMDYQKLFDQLRNTQSND